MAYFVYKAVFVTAVTGKRPVVATQEAEGS